MMDEERCGYYAVIRLLRRLRSQPHGVAMVVLSSDSKYSATK